MSELPPQPQGPPPSAAEVRRLRAEIRGALRAQGFRLKGGLIVPPDLRDKQVLRDLHASAVAHRVRRAEGGLRRHEGWLIQSLARNVDVDVEAFAPRVVEVVRGSKEELISAGPRFIGASLFLRPAGVCAFSSRTLPPTDWSGSSGLETLCSR